MTKHTKVKKWKITVVNSEGDVFETIKSGGEMINECLNQNPPVPSDLLMQVITGHCFMVVRSDKSKMYFCCCGHGKKHEDEASS